MNEKYIQLEMILSRIISEKMNVSIENETNNYLNEEVAYKYVIKLTFFYAIIFMKGLLWLMIKILMASS